MSDIYVVYFSSTGNTEEMAKHVADGIERKGGNPILTEIGSADPDQFCEEAIEMAKACQESKDPAVTRIFQPIESSNE